MEENREKLLIRIIQGKMCSSGFGGIIWCHFAICPLYDTLGQYTPAETCYKKSRENAVKELRKVLSEEEVNNLIFDEVL